MLIKPKDPDEASSTGQGLGAPWVPPTVYECSSPPYVHAYAHEDGSAVASDWFLNAWAPTGTLEMAPAVWPPGELSGHAIVGGETYSLPAGPYLYHVEVHYDYEYHAGCWSFMSIAGAGADFCIEIDLGDGHTWKSALPIFYVNSIIVGGNGAAEIADQTVTFWFTRDGSQPAEISVMAGISAHAEAGGSPFSGYAGVTFDACTIRGICLKSV